MPPRKRKQPTKKLSPSSSKSKKAVAATKTRGVSSARTKQPPKKRGRYQQKNQQQQQQQHIPPPEPPKVQPLPGSAAASFVQLKSELEKDAAGVMRMDAASWNSRITEFEIREYKPTSLGEFDTRIYDAFGYTLKVRVDNSCAPLELGAVFGHTGTNAVLFQKCQYSHTSYIGKKCVGTSGVVHVELLDTEDDVQEWKGRCKFYYWLSKNRPKYTLKIESAWTCDSSELEIPGSVLFEPIKGRSGKVGFVLATLPKDPDRYIYWPLREYILTSVPNVTKLRDPASGKWWDFDWDKVEVKYYNGSGIAKVLLDLAFNLNLDPSALNPDLLGVLVDTEAQISENPATGISLVISPLPKLMPAMSVNHEPTDDIKKTIIIIMEAIKAAIYGGIETQAGRRISPYQPNINKWQKIMRGLMGVGVTTWFVEYFWPAAFNFSGMSLGFGYAGIPHWLIGKIGGLLFVSLMTLGRMAFMGEFIRVVTKGAMEQHVPGPKYISR